MDPFIGEIRMWAGAWTEAPYGWEFCNGQQLRIVENQELFALIGIRYGGDGVTYFNLPDLRCRLPIGMSSTYPLAAKTGTETVTLTANQLPAHSHAANCSSATADQNGPGADVWAKSGTAIYSTAAPNVALHEKTIQTAGAIGTPRAHDNMMPYQTISFMIATQGIWPQQQ